MVRNPLNGIIERIIRIKWNKTATANNQLENSNILFFIYEYIFKYNI